MFNKLKKKELSELVFEGALTLGIVYLLICCVGWAVYTIVAKPLLDRHDSFTVTAVTMLIAAPIMIKSLMTSLPAPLR